MTEYCYAIIVLDYYNFYALCPLSFAFCFQGARLSFNFAVIREIVLQDFQCFSFEIVYFFSLFSNPVGAPEHFQRDTVFVCLFGCLNHLTMTHSSIKKALNSMDEPVSYLHITI